MTQQKLPESTNNNSEKKPELQKNKSPLLPSAAKSRYEKKRSLIQRVWNWTGFEEKKLWDVLQLLIVPTALAIGAFYLQETAKQRDLQIADDRAKQETLNRYFDQISSLLFEQKLRTTKEGGEARIIARARTLTTLRNLDGERRGDLIRFMFEAELIQGKKPTIDLTTAELGKADLTGTNLSGIFLTDANLSEAELSGAELTDANLSETFLIRANLTEANLTDANLSKAILIRANLNGANLTKANLISANLISANLSGANLIRANLSGANLINTNLIRANLSGAMLHDGALKNAYICRTKMPDGTTSDRDCDKLKPKK